MTDMLTVLHLDKHGRPEKHWSGRTQAVKVLRSWVCTHQPHYVSQDEATDIVEDILRAYLAEQR